MNPQPAIEPRVIVALDYSDAARALTLASSLSPEWCRVKVGLELYLSGGDAVVQALRKLGFDVFLDLKFHDIPNTVARACAQAARLGVWMMNVHAQGGPGMLSAARQAIDESSHRPLLIGVTILTSQADGDPGPLGVSGSIRDQVVHLSDWCHGAGLDGVVCSSHEAGALRSKYGRGFTLVTPGIRLPGNDNHDQRRTMTPREALRNGADYLVVGRPITGAADPRSALAAINSEIVGGRDESTA